MVEKNIVRGKNYRSLAPKNHWPEENVVCACVEDLYHNHDKKCELLLQHLLQNYVEKKEKISILDKQSTTESCLSWYIPGKGKTLKPALGVSKDVFPSQNLPIYNYNRTKI